MEILYAFVQVCSLHSLLFLCLLLLWHGAVGMLGYIAMEIEGPRPSPALCGGGLTPMGRSQNSVRCARDLAVAYRRHC